MKIEMKTITPADAERMLKDNVGNNYRAANKSHVSTLAHEMKRGRWKQNGDTICINGTRLIDGQHRLMAVVESGCTIQTLLVDGLDDHVGYTIDLHLRRTHTDTLAVQGIAEPYRMAPALKLVDRYTTGRMLQLDGYTNGEIVGLLNKYPDLSGSIEKIRETKSLAPIEVLTACHYLFSKKDAEAAEHFVQDFLSGLNLLSTDPVHVLRERMVHKLLAKKKLRCEAIMIRFLKAWNNRHAGNPEWQMRIPRGKSCAAVL